MEPLSNFLLKSQNEDYSISKLNFGLAEIQDTLNNLEVSF